MEVGDCDSPHCAVKNFCLLKLDEIHLVLVFVSINKSIPSSCF